MPVILIKIKLNLMKIHKNYMHQHNKKSTQTDTECVSKL